MLNTLGRNLKCLCFTPNESPPSIPDPHHPTRPSPTSFITNFNSLFDLTAPVTSSTTDSESLTATPDFATAIASRRFFFSSPGRSNSIIDSSSQSSSSHSSSVIDIGPSDPDNVLGGGVAIQTYSPDPYVDFRRSMEEMVESRGLQELDVRESWDQLHELLTCYLALNPKCTHKFILAAFADLLVSLMSKMDDPMPSNVI